MDLCQDCNGMHDSLSEYYENNKARLSADNTSEHQMMHKNLVQLIWQEGIETTNMIIGAGR